mmetsp:Transcript_32180/g.61920  ORF Transcript_32180/g.61920 Transcript_32180/m.61920 type:complete len:722 (-) Transcript_32180:449-2614(-)|eukprot:CAMPEP_0114255928 /NCGR_PEP_ID=MMETSP0058-20121206/17855_1 /TAXON_ID=36894 /ORGANISM="Pyramimonas parkeae, CCMP726" /LENGTH=721 /DNA_ID=CAMNT_0001370409 /DNA_START=265 /DNA_END=2430 /DNA_ORIENTATION=+
MLTSEKTFSRSAWPRASTTRVAMLHLLVLQIFADVSAVKPQQQHEGGDTQDHNSGGHGLVAGHSGVKGENKKSKPNRDQPAEVIASVNGLGLGGDGVPASKDATRNNNAAAAAAALAAVQAASAASSALAAGSGAVRLDATAAPFAETIHLISSPTRYKDNTLANQIEKALEKEFPDDSADIEGSAGRSYNDTVKDKKGVLETVARVTHERFKGARPPPPVPADAFLANGDVNPNATKPRKKNDVESILASLEDTASQIDKAFGMSKSSESEPEDVARLIDAEDNEFVISNPKKGSMELQQDLQFISDLVVMIVCAAIGGVIFASMGQPVITGYLLAGSICGPGGFGLVNELVQVETLAQFGVVFLLFALGVEFSASKLRHVGGVAVLGGLLQVLLLMFVCGTLAKLGGGPISEGVFIGSFLSMSSTAVVLKCLQDRNWLQYLHGQVIIATLILQDCIVGLLFALLPVLGGNGEGENNFTSGLFSILRELVVLVLFLAFCFILTQKALPMSLSYLASLTTQSEELYQLVLVAFCLSVAWCSDYLGLSIELGAFVAGVMISVTEYAERTIQQIEPIRNIFAALFLASIGLIMNPLFLWTHIDILFASLLVVVVAKVTLTTVVVRAFGYSPRVAFTVGVCLAQIGEFAFVLLSRASNLGLVQKKLYLLLLGTTALSIVSTPIMFRSIPYLVRLGTLMRWLRREEGDTEELPQQVSHKPSKPRK